MIMWISIIFSKYSQYLTILYLSSTSNPLFLFYSILIIKFLLKLFIVYGLASLAGRTGVFSFARYDDNFWEKNPTKPMNLMTVTYRACKVSYLKIEIFSNNPTFFNNISLSNSTLTLLLYRLWLMKLVICLVYNIVYTFIV